MRRWNLCLLPAWLNVWSWHGAADSECPLFGRLSSRNTPRTSWAGTGIGRFVELL
jgi:hypothetical protein